jgi:hypothetical protein
LVIAYPSGPYLGRSASIRRSGPHRRQHWSLDEPERGTYGSQGARPEADLHGQQLLDSPSGVTSATGGAILAIDNQNFTAANVMFEQANEWMMAHELGHTLELWHGDGTDNDSDRGYDQLCDPGMNEEPATTTLPAFCNTPTTFMSSSACGNLSTAMMTNQRNTSRALAVVYTGANTDPPGTLIPSPNVGDQRTDPPLDVSDKGIDIIQITIQENTDTGTTSFSHRLLGIIPPDSDPERQYVVFADLDGDGGTGGAPSSLGFSTSFGGAELVTRVRVSEVIIESPAVFVAMPTVWQFENGAFQQITDERGCGDPSSRRTATDGLFT